MTRCRIPPTQRDRINLHLIPYPADLQIDQDLLPLRYWKCKQRSGSRFLNSLMHQSLFVLSIMMGVLATANYRRFLVQVPVTTGVARWTPALFALLLTVLTGLMLGAFLSAS